MRENQIASLFSNIQSNENYHSKFLKIKYYASYILADCLQLDIGIKGWTSISKRSKELNGVLLVINHYQREYPNYKTAFKALRNKR